VREIESLQAVEQDTVLRHLALRMAGLPRGWRLPGFAAAVGSDAELDAETKATVLEPTGDETCVLAAEDSVRATACLD
jgi:hypothetical protein